MKRAVCPECRKNHLVMDFMPSCSFCTDCFSADGKGNVKLPKSYFDPRGWTKEKQQAMATVSLCMYQEIGRRVAADLEARVLGAM